MNLLTTDQELIDYKSLGFDILKSNDPLSILEKFNVKEKLISLSVKPLSLDQMYGRNVLFADSSLEVMLASWREGQACWAHNHGKSRGKVINLSGDFEEVGYQLKNGELEPFTQSIKKEGCVMDVLDGQIHSMKSLGEHGVTLHIYSPAIEEMSVYDQEKKQTYIVDDGCGAWKPNEQQIKAKETWS